MNNRHLAFLCGLAAGFALGAFGVLAFGVATDMHRGQKRRTPAPRAQATTTPRPQPQQHSQPKPQPQPAARPAAAGSLLNTGLRPATARQAVYPLRGHTGRDDLPRDPYGAR